MSAPPAEELLKQWESEQARLRQQVVEEDTEDWQRSPDFSGLERVGGVDLSFIKGDDVNACAQLVVLSYPDLEVLYEDSQMVTLTAPYMAGFLAFRETPFLLEALQRLEENQPQLLPQVVFVDGNGLFHYREFGLACHLGVLSGLPCVGVAKNLLQVPGVNKGEEHQSQIAALQKGGDSFPLTAASGKVLGKALRSSDKSSKPVYVSVGHKISVDTAVRLTHSCCRYRVPEPIRQADCRSREYLRTHQVQIHETKNEIQDEFHRITTVHLESKFMSKLDEYTPRLLNLFHSKGRTMGLRLQAILLKAPSNPSINMTRDVVVQCLMVYLGESMDHLLKEYDDADEDSVSQDLAVQRMKIYNTKANTSEGPDDIGIVIEGMKVLTALGNFPRACSLLVGLAYAVNLAYPKELRYTLEVFQKLFLELDCLNLSPKVNSLKNKLLA